MAGFDRGVRPIGDWSTRTSLSTWSRPVDPGVPARHLPGAVELVGQHGRQDVVDQRRLARARHPGDRGEHPQRERDVDLAQVVLPRPHHGQLPSAVDRPPDSGNLDALPAGEVGAGEGLAVAQQLGEVPLCTICPPCSPAPGPMSTTQSACAMVSSSCSTTISVLPRSRSRDQGLDQPAVVALMQADRRLVEHVEHADQPGADLGGQPDALRLTAGQRGRRARQRQVVQPDVEQEPQPRLHLLEHLPGDRLLARAQRQRVQELRRSRRSTAPHTSAMDFSPRFPAASVTARISGLSRVPSQTGHGTSRM